MLKRSISDLKRVTWCGIKSIITHPGPRERRVGEGQVQYVGRWRQEALQTLIEPVYPLQTGPVLLPGRDCLKQPARIQQDLRIDHLNRLVREDGRPVFGGCGGVAVTRVEGAYKGPEATEVSY